MKKLLVLALVLAVASLASAAISWDVADNGDGSYAVSLNSQGSQVTAVRISVMMSDNTGSALSEFTSPFPALGDNLLAQPGPYAVAGISYSRPDPTFAPIADGSVFSFNYVGNAGDVIALSSNGNFVSGDLYVATTTDNVSLTGELGSITIVPEPMTIGLLGLGGLFLRRRKK